MGAFHHAAFDPAAFDVEPAPAYVFRRTQRTLIIGAQNRTIAIRPILRKGAGGACCTKTNPE